MPFPVDEENPLTAGIDINISPTGLPYNAHQMTMSHSFRIGHASDLASMGIPNDIIKRLGRWKSNAVAGYIRN